VPPLAAAVVVAASPPLAAAVVVAASPPLAASSSLSLLHAEATNAMMANTANSLTNLL
jgi:hypothetical protein